MIKQSFTIESYWKVVVYYDLDYHFFGSIADEMIATGANENTVQDLYYEMKYGKTKAVTLSNLRNHISYVLFNKHKTEQDYIDSIVHEAEHVKQAILDVYDIKDEGEDAAYTIGYIVGQMYRGFYRLMCSCNKS